MSLCEVEAQDRRGNAPDGRNVQETSARSLHGIFPPDFWVRNLWLGNPLGMARNGLSLRVSLVKSESLSRFLYLPLQIAPKTLFQISDKMLEMLGDWCYFRHAGVSLLSKDSVLAG